MSGAAGTLHPDLQIPSAILAHPPSRKDGVDAPTERAYRIFGCELIAEMALRLHAPQVVAATAQTLLHRFYYRKSLGVYDVHLVALAALFLSGKVEEQPRRMRDILNVCYAAKLRRQGKPPRALVLGGALYAGWKAELIRTERIMLKELGFSMYNIMEHPHKFLLYYVRALGLGEGALAHMAWALLNDSLRLDLCVRYHAQSIACAAIYAAARIECIPLPKAVPWYTVFSTGRAEMEDIAEQILSLYDDEGDAGGERGGATAGSAAGGRPGALPLQPHRWLPSLRPGARATADDDDGEPTMAAVEEAARVAAAAAAAAAVVASVSDAPSTAALLDDGGSASIR